MLSKIQSQALQAIIYTCLGYGAFTITDSILKMLVASYSMFFVLLLGSLTSLCLVTIYGFIKHGADGFLTQNLSWHLLRAVAITVTSSMNALALRTLQMDEFYAIVFITPFVLTIMAHLLLKEPINRKQIYGILGGFASVLYMVRPGQDLFQAGALFVGIGMLFYTINCLIMRILKDRDPIFIFPFFSSLSISIASMAALLILPEATFPAYISVKDGFLFFGLGAIGSLGMAGVTIGLQKAPTIAVVAPFHYTQMIWGIIAGYLLFGDLPSFVTITGAIGLIITGVYVLNHETKKTHAANN